MKSKDELQAELDAILSKIARLESKNTSDGTEQYFHLGMVGGSGHNVQKLNERRMEAMDRTIDRSLELTPLYKERDRLAGLIDSYDQRLERQQRRVAEREAALDRLRNVKPGQQVIVVLGNTVTVKRVSKKSITTDTGSRWSFDELIDVAS